jgi:hypothetical protein
MTQTKTAEDTGDAEELEFRRSPVDISEAGRAP